MHTLLPLINLPKGSLTKKKPYSGKSNSICISNKANSICVYTHIDIIFPRPWLGIQLLGRNAFEILLLLISNMTVQVLRKVIQNMDKRRNNLVVLYVSGQVIVTH